MIAKNFRLSHSTWFMQRQKQPLRVINTPIVSLKIFPTTLLYSRIGIVVGTKINKRATARNRIRRAIYDVFQKNLKNLPTKDYICITRTAINQLTPKVIQETIEQILKK